MNPAWDRSSEKMAIDIAILRDAVISGGVSPRGR
jgi:hypothetical protein